MKWNPVGYYDLMAVIRLPPNVKQTTGLEVAIVHVVVLCNVDANGTELDAKKKWKFLFFNSTMKTIVLHKIWHDME